MQDSHGVIRVHRFEISQFPSTDAFVGMNIAQILRLHISHQEGA